MRPGTAPDTGGHGNGYEVGLNMAGELLFIFAILFVGILIAVLFAVSLTLKLLGGVLRILFRPWNRQQGMRHASQHPVACPRDGCGAVNPSTARFCRRCGHGLSTQAPAVGFRHAACW